MPHKHKRKRGGDDDTDFDLPPSQKARPLPVASKSRGAAQSATQSTTPSKKKARGRKKDDDAPRAFKRLMAVAQGKRVRSGLDDGSDGKNLVKDTSVEAPKIRPGEDLRSYAVRVDAALPVSGLTKKTVIKDGKDEAGMKVYRTRKERKMHKLYDQWHAEERKINERKEQELEQAAEKALEKDAADITSASLAEFDEEVGKTKTKGRRRRAQVEEDPWLILKRKRGEAKVGLHDTAQAPPELNKKMSHQLKVGGAAVAVENVPKASGSLRRREELQAIRTDVVDAYRKMRELEQSKLTRS